MIQDSPERRVLLDLEVPVKRFVAPLSGGLRSETVYLEEKRGCLKISIPGAYMFLTHEDFITLQELLKDVEIRKDKDGVSRFYHVSEITDEELNDTSLNLTPEEIAELEPEDCIKCEIEDVPDGESIHPSRCPLSAP